MKTIIFLILFSATSMAKVKVSSIECALDKPCPQEYTCAAVKGHNTPVCLKKGEECQKVCGKKECTIAESYPVQIICVGPLSSPSKDSSQGNSKQKPLGQF